MPSSGHPDEGVLRDLVDRVVSGRGLAYREAAILQVQYKMLSPAIDVRYRLRGGRTAAQVLSKGLKARRIPATMDCFTVPALGHGTDLLVQGKNQPWDEFIDRVNGIASVSQLSAVRDYIAWQLAGQAVPQISLKPLPEDALTFGRFQALLTELMQIESEGAVQQFGIAALLRAYHEQEATGLSVRTKKVFAPDRFSKALGDIEVVDQDVCGKVVDAYEVTLRGWTDRLDEAEEKAALGGLGRIHIVADVAEDPVQIAKILSHHRSTDIIVLDYRCFIGALAAALDLRHRGKAVDYWDSLLGQHIRLARHQRAFREALQAFHVAPAETPNAVSPDEGQDSAR